MKIGVTLFAADYAMRPDAFARACEERGCVLPGCASNAPC